MAIVALTRAVVLFSLTKAFVSARWQLNLGRLISLGRLPLSRPTTHNSIFSHTIVFDTCSQHDADFISRLLDGHLDGPFVRILSADVGIGG